MAKIYTDVLLLGNELSGLIAGALLSKRGLKVHHFKNPFGSNNHSPTYIHSLWPGYRDHLNRKIFDELDLNLDFTRQFNSNSNFAFIEEGKSAIYAYSSHENPSKDIVRSFKKTGIDFANAILVGEPVLLENALALAAAMPVRSLFFNHFKMHLLKKKLGRNTPLTALGKLSAAVSSDPGKLLSISNFFPTKLCAPSPPSLTLALLAYKHGLNLPKDESSSTHEALSKLIQNSIKKHGGIIDTKQEIAHIYWDKKRLQEITTKNGETFVAKAVIDATHLSLNHCWPKISPALPPPNTTNDLSLKVSIHSDAVSQAFPRCGFFYCPIVNSEILCQYQILSPPPRAELSTIPTQTEPDALTKMKILHLKLICLDGDLPDNTLIGEAHRLIKRHFSLEDLPAGHVEQICLPSLETTSPSVLTNYVNQFRATPQLTPTLGINGEFATAHAIFSTMGRIFRYKP